ncbi:MAG: hypothetical protein NTX15_07880 [Candidatus Kapabacteria bacterium]|nr:hypothetical protein [Candidatus Kapabacteria bacterium]
MQAQAQLVLTGVSIPGVGSFVDASDYPVIRARFRATRAGQPAVLTATDISIFEANRFIGVNKLSTESQGVYTAEFATSLYTPVINSIPTTVFGTVILYGVSNADVGTLPVSWSLSPWRGGTVNILDSAFRQVPYYIDFGDVPIGKDSLRKLNVHAFEATRGTNGNERGLKLDTLLTRSNNFRIVWKGTYGTKPPPVEVESGSDYRFDLICSPKVAGPISDVLTLVYEGGAHYDVMVLANTPSYKATTVLQVVAPNGGENLTPCQAINIRWKGAIQGFYTHADYSTDNGRSWKFIDSTLDSTIVWSVPSEYSDSARVRCYQKQGVSGARFLSGESSPATNLAFNATGRYLAVAYGSGLIAEWDIVTSQIVNRYNAEGVAAPTTKVSAMSYVGSSRNILAIVDRPFPSKDQIQRFQQSSPSPTARIDVDMNQVVEIGTDVSGTNAFVVGNVSGRIRVYDAVTLTERTPIDLTSPSATGKIADGILTAALIDGNVVRYDTQTQREISRYTTNIRTAGGPTPNFVGASRSAELVAIAGLANPGAGNAGQEQRTFIYDMKKDALIRVIYRSGLNSVGVTFNPSATFLTLGFMGQQQIQQYDIVNRKILGPTPGMPGHSNLMTDVEYGPDGSTLASCSDDVSNNLLLRRIIIPESDESDGVFKILPLNMSSTTISMGKKYIGTGVDTVVVSTICNDGIVPAVFQSGSLLFNTWLKIADPIADDTVLPGKCLSVRFVAALRDIGRLVDTLNLTSCGVKFRVPITSTSVDRDLTVFGNMTDFGNVCVSDTGSVALTLVRNNDPIDVVINGITMRKGVSSQFRVRGYTPGTTLASGKSLDAEILFVPRVLGADTDEVVISYAGQVNVTRTIRVIGYGAGAEIQLSHPTLAFIPEISEREVVLTNRSANNVELTSATLPTGAPFTLLTTVPLTIRGKDSIRLRIRYDGGSISGNDVMALAFAPCASSLGIRLVSYSGTATISAPIVSADPRGDATIPIQSDITESVAYNGERTYEGIIQVNPRLFLARSIVSDLGVSEIVSQEITDGSRQIRFRVVGSFRQKQEIARLVGPAGLAEIDSSILSFDTTALAYGTSVVIKYSKGLLRILNPDPNRHIIHPSPLSIRSITPQPASDDLTITVLADEDIVGTLTISDQQGVIHQRIPVRISKGSTPLKVNCGDLPPGVHMVLINGGRHSTSTSVVVLR